MLAKRVRMINLESLPISVLISMSAAWINTLTRVCNDGRACPLGHNWAKICPVFGKKCWAINGRDWGNYFEGRYDNEPRS